MKASTTNDVLTHAVGTRKLKRGARDRESVTLVGLTFPGALFYAFFVLAPVIIGLILSLTNWNGLAPPKYVGLSNFAAILHDPAMATSLLVTVEYIGITWIIQCSVSMAIGIYFAGRPRVAKWLGPVFMMPLMFSSVAIAITWQYLLDPNLGVLAQSLRAVGLGHFIVDWLGNSTLAVYVVGAIASWQFISFYTLLFQVGAQQIPRELIEAATLDGATQWHVWRHILLPQLKYTTSLVSILIVIGGLTGFEYVYILTDGGPGSATTTLGLYTYSTAFQSAQLGYANALSMVMVVLGLILALVLVAISRFGRMESQLEGM